MVTSLVMGGLANAGRALQGPDFPSGLVGTLQGLPLAFTLGGEVFARYRIRRVPRSGDGPVDGDGATGVNGNIAIVIGRLSAIFYGTLACSSRRWASLLTERSGVLNLGVEG